MQARMHLTPLEKNRYYYFGRATPAQSVSVRTRRAVSMSLEFPNESRSYDTTRRAIRFWGYDRSMEVSFFVTIEALCRVTSKMLMAESDFLGAFDTHRPRIRDAAKRAYAGPKRGSYELGVRDL